MSKIETVLLLTFLAGAIWLGGYTLYEINTTDIHGIVSGFNQGGDR